MKNSDNIHSLEKIKNRQNFYRRVQGLLGEHLDHLFRIYIKALGKDTVCRVEEAKLSKVLPIDPMERIGKQLTDISGRLDKLTSFQGPADKRGA